MNHRRSTQLLLAAAAIAAPALLTACGTESSASAEEVTGGAPGSSAPADPKSAPADAPEGGVTAEDLLTDADTEYSDGADWFAFETWTSAGQQLFSICAATGLADTGATSAEGRGFELRNLDRGAPAVEGDLLTQVVAEYDDEAAATKAWSTVNGWLQECDGRPDEVTDYRALQTRKISVPGADAVITDAHYGPLPADLADGDAAYIAETGVVRVGNRLTVLSSVVVGQDYNFTDGTPVERMLVPAVKRLQD